MYVLSLGDVCPDRKGYPVPVLECCSFPYLIQFTQILVRSCRTFPKPKLYFLSGLILNSILLSDSSFPNRVTSLFNNLPLYDTRGRRDYAEISPRPLYDFKSAIVSC